MILLHGYGGSVMHWDPLIEKLKTNYTVLVLNLSHIYMSTDKLSFSQQVDLVAKYFSRTHELQRAHWVGMSYGGAIAWAMALRYPELVASLTLINPMVPHPLDHFHRSNFKHYFRLPLPATALSFVLSTPLGKSFLFQAAEVFRQEKSSHRVQAHELKGRKLLFVAQMISHFSWLIRNEKWELWEKEFSSMKVPSMLIYDREDPLFAKDSYLSLAGKLKIQNILELTGAGHLPALTQPDSIFTEIYNFHRSQLILKTG